MLLSEPPTGQFERIPQTVRPAIVNGLGQHFQILRIAQQGLQPSLVRLFDERIGVPDAVVLREENSDLLIGEVVEMEYRDPLRGNRVQTLAIASQPVGLPA